MSGLIAFLENNRERRGIMADLRCGLSPLQQVRAWPQLIRFCPKGLVGHDYEVTRTIAGLFAAHPMNSRKGSLGSLCRRLCSPEEAEALSVWSRPGGEPERESGPMGKRMQYLLAAGRDEICGRVIRIVLFAKSKEEPVNYAQLEKDLRNWPGKRVREHWAADFWGLGSFDQTEPVVEGGVPVQGAPGPETEQSEDDLLEALQ